MPRSSAPSANSWTAEAYTWVPLTIFPAGYPKNHERAAAFLGSSLDAGFCEPIRGSDTRYRYMWPVDKEIVSTDLSGANYGGPTFGVRSVTHVGYGGPRVDTGEPDPTSTNKTAPNMGKGTLYMHDPVKNKIYITSDEVGSHISARGESHEMTVCQKSKDGKPRNVTTFGPGGLCEGLADTCAISTLQIPESLKRKR